MATIMDGIITSKVISKKIMTELVKENVHKFILKYKGMVMFI
jgi:hypothetical protein